MKNVILILGVLLLSSCYRNYFDNQINIVQSVKIENYGKSYHIETERFGLYTNIKYQVGDTISFKRN